MLPSIFPHSSSLPLKKLVLKFKNIIGKLKQQRWQRIMLYIVILAVLSVGLSYLVRYLLAYFNISPDSFAAPVYAVVFIVTLVCNASIIIPVPIHMSIIIAAAEMMTEVSPWSPVLVVLTASIAGTLGEISGYYAGYLGKKILFDGNTPGYNSMASWMKRHGPLAIFLISLQPILPVDIAGIISGVSRIPLWKFLLPCWAGKFLKYLIWWYFGSSLLNFLPF